MSDTVIKVEHLSKYYNLGTIGSGTLYRDFQSWWARIRGKEDPNTQLGTWDESQIDKDKGFWALKDVSFEVKQGDVVGIIGRNGAGKSTLLKILSRVTGPTFGNIKIKGRVASLLEVGTGFHPELTGRENIYLNGTILGMRKAEIDKKFDEIVAFAEIEKFIDTPVKRYSSGMYVRLAFAVAAHLDPEILIVDEVLAVGDAAFQKKCLGKMSEVSKEGRTVLFVSHNMGAIQNLCNKGIYLSQGQLEAVGDIESIVERYFSSGQKTRDIIIPPINEGQIGFISWEFEGASLEKRYSCISREICTFNFMIKSKLKIENVRIGYIIYGHQGERILSVTSNDMYEKKWSFDRGTYLLKIKVRLPIKPGTYSLNINMKVGQEYIASWNCEPSLLILPQEISQLSNSGQGILNEKVEFIYEKIGVE